MNGWPFPHRIGFSLQGKLAWSWLICIPMSFPGLINRRKTFTALAINSVTGSFTPPTQFDTKAGDTADFFTVPRQQKQQQIGISQQEQEQSFCAILSRFEWMGPKQHSTPTNTGATNTWQRTQLVWGTSIECKTRLTPEVILHLHHLVSQSYCPDLCIASLGTQVDPVWSEYGQSEYPKNIKETISYLSP